MGAIEHVIKTNMVEYILSYKENTWTIRKAGEEGTYVIKVKGVWSEEFTAYETSTGIACIKLITLKGDVYDATVASLYERLKNQAV